MQPVFLPYACEITWCFSLCKRLGNTLHHSAPLEKPFKE
nr:MAG TPA: hypothetical protein [Caudoviricetes sp.]